MGTIFLHILLKLHVYSTDRTGEMRRRCGTSETESAIVLWAITNTLIRYLRNQMIKQE